jgi:hypothetical protein
MIPPRRRKCRTTGLCRRPDDGLDRPALPVLPPPHRAARPALHRDDHGRRARSTATFRITSTSIRPSIRSRCSWAAVIQSSSRRAPGSASAGATTRSISTAAVPRNGCRPAASGLVSWPSRRSSPICVKAMRDAGVPARHGQAPDRARTTDESYALGPRFRRARWRGRLRGLHRPRAQRGAEGPFAEGDREVPRCATTSSGS